MPPKRVSDQQIPRPTKDGKDVQPTARGNLRKGCVGAAGPRKERKTPPSPHFLRRACHMHDAAGRRLIDSRIVSLNAPLPALLHLSVRKEAGFAWAIHPLHTRIRVSWYCALEIEARGLQDCPDLVEGQRQACSMEENLISLKKPQWWDAGRSCPSSCCQAWRILASRFARFGWWEPHLPRVMLSQVCLHVLSTSSPATENALVSPKVGRVLHHICKRLHTARTRSHIGWLPWSLATTARYKRQYLVPAMASKFVYTDAIGRMPFHAPSTPPRSFCPNLTARGPWP